MAGIVAPAHVQLGTGDTEIVAERANGSAPIRVFLLVVNTDNIARWYTINRYDSDGGESAAQSNAIAWREPLAPKTARKVEVSLTLTEGWKISGRASVASGVIVHVDAIEE